MRWALLAVILGALLLTGASRVGQAASTPAYLALGDSLAVGTGATDPAQGGYVALFHQYLSTTDRYRTSGITLINLGVGGETSSSMRQPGGQLDKALAELTRRNGDADDTNDVEVITIDIGGNDLLAIIREPVCIEDPSSQSCVDAALDALNRLAQNLSAILPSLRQAAGPDALLMVLTLYNPFSGTGTPFDEQGGLILSLVNATIGKAATDPQVAAVVVDIAALFEGKGPELTHILEDDIHPNDQGYRAIADAFASAYAAAQQQVAAALPVTGSGVAGGQEAVWPYGLVAFGLVLVVVGLGGRRWARQ